MFKKISSTEVVTEQLAALAALRGDLVYVPKTQMAVRCNSISWGPSF